MYIICLFEQWYVRVNPTDWDELYNPHFATLFASEKDANNWVKKNTTFAEYAKAVDSEESIKKYNEWIDKGSIRRSFALVDNTLSRKYNGESAEDVLKWRLTVEPDSIRYEDYATWPNLHQKFNNLFQIERYHRGKDEKTLISLSIFFRKTAKFKVFRKELDLVLPSVTLIEDGYKIFSVFDHFLSEGGNSVKLFYKADNDCEVRGRYCNTIKGTLKDCFDYLVKNRYYE